MNPSKIFIGSSKEAKDIASTVQYLLAEELDSADVWKWTDLGSVYSWILYD
ncbi:hypothetical protein LJC71_05405 [Desulfosarcina sp. OttesenSCG-928-A07]|nr:hypothetical protein [Desulfosarcina sp. OttesenSCG-928-G17]MDL2329173.1 hypothetical protein [Desulfosarcina sp. OttesenSCG-928-A07]